MYILYGGEQVAAGNIVCGVILRARWSFYQCR